jgi:signal transduction histidine kinase
MTATTDTTSPRVDSARKIEELGRIILAYSEATERLQASHQTLTHRVEQLQAELSDKNRQLERRNRLAALGEMAAGIAHEVRNPLGAIKLYASLLRQDVAAMPTPAQTVEKIIAAAQRVETIVSQVLYFTREVRANIVDADLADVVREAVELARVRSPDGGVAFVVAGPDRLPARFDRTLVSQALVNLLVNGVEACGESGHVFVEFGRSESPRQFVIGVRDSGPGIDESTRERLFHPFFTTKDHGTGLGLALVHRIVEAHDGLIEARNAREGGAEFQITV